MHDDEAMKRMIDELPIPGRLAHDLTARDLVCGDDAVRKGVPPTDPRLTAPNGVYLGHDWKEAVHLAAAGAMARKPLPFLKPTLTAKRPAGRNLRDSTVAAAYVFLVMFTMLFSGFVLGYWYATLR